MCLRGIKHNHGENENNVTGGIRPVAFALRFNCHRGLFAGLADGNVLVHRRKTL